jgi:hypothetical protein
MLNIQEALPVELSGTFTLYMIYKPTDNRYPERSKMHQDSASTSTPQIGRLRPAVERLWTEGRAGLLHLYQHSNRLGRSTDNPLVYAICSSCSTHAYFSLRAFQCSPKRGLQRAASPLPEREVSSHPPLLPAAAGGKKEHWKALTFPYL